VPEEELTAVQNVQYPVFYMNYNLRPYEIPWRDTIGNAVKFLDGEEYTISRPRDLWRAVSQMVTQIMERKQAVPASLAAPARRSRSSVTSAAAGQ
jgi:hypothetical protein